ncbi:hypothetical protein P3L51_22390 [Streptomyces sp. PSRA5]|uniref:hypothetical protein n=1 Tax=Streptomyces panacea TaxID=3035064 RepID=UPI00339CD245
MNSPLPVPAGLPLTRRRPLSDTGALGLGALLTACGDRSWSFEDDRGRTARTGQPPQRVVAFVSAAAALHDYGVECVGVLGPTDPIGGKPNPQAGELDLTKLTGLGKAWGEFNIEKYAALEPDPLISNMFPPPDLWYVPAESVTKIEALAPSVGITARKAVDAKARFDRAERTPRQAAAAKKKDGGLKVHAMTDDAGRPTWNRLPAVKAGQITPWSMEKRYSYAGYAPVLEQLTAAITKSRSLAR